MAKRVYYSGKVHTVVYADPSQAFYILKMVMDPDKSMPMFSVTPEPLSVKGYVPGIAVKIGTWFGFEGEWISHPKFGQQLDIKRAPVIQGGWDDEAIENILTSNGVGLQIVRSIRLKFPDDFQAALEDPLRLVEVPGLSPLAADTVIQRWKSVQAHYNTLDFLGNLGIPSGCIRGVWSTFGDDSQDILTKNPWALVQIEGISFTNADNAARNLGLNMEDPNRVRGAVLAASRISGSFGHLYQKTGNIYDGVVREIPDLSKKDFALALKGLHDDGLLIVDKDTRMGTTAIYEPWCYQIEVESAALLRDRRITAAWAVDDRTREYVVSGRSVGPKCEALVKPHTDKEAWLKLSMAESEGHVWEVAKQAVAEWGEQAHLDLSVDQIQGVINALAAPISILSGLPGTGKTTSLQAAVRILQDMEVPFLLCAPTGIAAKNLAARTGANASTIHRAFSAKGIRDESREAGYVGVQGSRKRAITTNGMDGDWGYDQDHPHKAEVIIVDEASMVDQHLLFRLLDCTGPTCRLVFVGDYAQLPSVGPGNVLRDLIASKQFPTVKLTQIFRQKDTSGIVYAAHDIHRGDMPLSSKDFRLVQIASEEKVLDAILKVSQKFYDTRINFQILSPRHSGTVGVTNLNARLRSLLNPQVPGVHEVKLGGDVIREGDRIMVVQNNYRLGVFNGNVGKIARIDQGKKEIEVKVFGKPPLHVIVKFKEAPKLIRLAYACTVHKSQGLEYDRIVMPIVTGFRHQLQRNLLYTAITRAKQQVVLIGHLEALRLAVLNAKEDDRMTLFLDRVGGVFGGVGA